MRIIMFIGSDKLADRNGFIVAGFSIYDGMMSSVVNCGHAYYQILGSRYLDQGFQMRELELRFLRGRVDREELWD